MLPELRRKVHSVCISALKNEGVIILQGFSKEQISFHSGGPKKSNRLYSIDELKADFISIFIKQLNTELSALNEGEYHQGEASLIQMIGIKKDLE